VALKPQKQEQICPLVGKPEATVVDNSWQA
jgi:hypothetical protein